MKRLLLLFSLLLIPSLSKAQYYNSYYPHLTAALTAEAIDAKQLDNIRFDPHALALNPEAWATYQTYLDQVEQYNKKKKNYTT